MRTSLAALLLPLTSLVVGGAYAPPARAADGVPPGEAKLAADEPGTEAPPLPSRPGGSSRPGGIAPSGAGVQPETGTEPAEAQGQPATPPPQPGAAPGAQPGTGTLPPPRLTEAKPALVSLIGADTLHGGAAMLGWAGWSSFGALYAQGITDQDDLGAQLDFDYATTEMRLGAWYRRPLGPAGPFRMAGRLGVSWYLDFGGGWRYGENHNDRGFELAPGLSFSTSTGTGLLTLLGDMPVTVTLKRGGGVLFSPRASVAYEVPFYGEYTLGARFGLGWRGGAGDAPIRGGHGEVQFLVLAGWRLF